VAFPSCKFEISADTFTVEVTIQMICIQVSLIPLEGAAAEVDAGAEGASAEAASIHLAIPSAEEGVAVARSEAAGVASEEASAAEAAASSLENLMLCYYFD